MKIDDDLIARCPRLGHEVPFSYCEKEAGALPCRQVVRCWEARFPVEAHLRESAGRGSLGAFLRSDAEGPADDAAGSGRRSQAAAGRKGVAWIFSISPTAGATTGRWPSGCGRGPSTNTWGRAICWARRASCARAVAEDHLFSVIFWGPPGSGKTTLARILAQETKSHFVSFSAVLSGVKEIRGVVDEATELWRHQRRRTILFVDEIHRFNKAQQDAFLPHVESGMITLIGATTENPSFEVIAPLLSRMRVLVLKPFTEEDLTRIVRERPGGP